MNFQETLYYLNELCEFRMRLSLEPSKRLLELLHHPDQSLKIVLVSGTNGKGSVCSFLTSIAKAQGISVGTFTSPHLESPMERIMINGQPISENTFARKATDLFQVLQGSFFGDITYFEFLTMMALLTFQEAKVDLALFEVGLGGRLDATNVLQRVLTITTQIDLDHTKILGNSIQEIANEKGAILRPNTLAIISSQHKEAHAVLISIGKKIGAKVILEERDYMISGGALSFSFSQKNLSIAQTQLHLRGDHQIHNAGCAVAASLALNSLGFDFTRESIVMGLANASLPGRLESWKNSNGQVLWLDVAHNPGAISAIVRFFQKKKEVSFRTLLGMTMDKDHSKVIGLLSKISKDFMLCKPATPRGWDPNEIAQKFCTQFQLTVKVNPLQALEFCLQEPQHILCTGSFYLVGEIRKELRKRGFKLEPVS